MLDFRMDTFLAVCRTMNFTRAAEVLNLTQPAVSQHIHHLEGVYGAKLFSYQGRKLALTPAGTLLLGAARTLHHDVTHLRQAVSALAEAPRPLHFGATLTVAEFALPAHLAAYLMDKADRPLQVTVANTQQLLDALDSGGLDFALVEGYFPRNDYSHKLYSREDYVAVCAPTHPLAHGTHALEDLLTHRLILREPGSGTRQVLEEHLGANGLTISQFSALVQLGSIGLIKAVAAAGAGVTFLYRRGVAEELAAGKLVEVPISNLQITHDFRFIWRKGSIFQDDYLPIFQTLGG